MQQRLQQGFTHIYTGNGKGKTTAAIGQVIRALGAGMNVWFAQFMKDFAYSELKILQQFSHQLTLIRFGNDRFVFKKERPSERLKNEIATGLRESRQAMLSEKYDLVILDEILVSIYFGLIQAEPVADLIKMKPFRVELILTGRYCPLAFYDLAGLVTEMKEIKHYYKQGVAARRGIES